MPTIKSGKALTSDEIDILTKWVRSGAKYVKPWAYISPIKTKVPESAQNLLLNVVMVEVGGYVAGRSAETHLCRPV